MRENAIGTFRVRRPPIRVRARNDQELKQPAGSRDFLLRRCLTLDAGGGGFDPEQLLHGAPLNRHDGRRIRPCAERRYALGPHLFEPLLRIRSSSFSEIGGDVGQFRHWISVPAAAATGAIYFFRRAIAQSRCRSARVARPIAQPRTADRHSRDFQPAPMSPQ